MITVRTTVEQNIQEPVAKELLNNFVDWLDENGLLRVGTDEFEFTHNSQLVDKFVEGYE